MRPARELTILGMAAALAIGVAWFSFAYQRCPQNWACVIDDVKEWQGLLAGLLALSAALIGGAFVISASNRQIRAVAAQFRDTIRPYVIARLSTRHGVIFCLEIANVGKSIATNLQLSMSRDFFQFAERRNVRDAPAFNKTIPNFAPGEILTFDLSQGFNLTDTGRTPHSFTISARYSFDDQTYNDTFDIDLAHYFDSLAKRSDSEHLEKIAEHLKTIAARK